MARTDHGRRRIWRFRLNEDTILEVSAPEGPTEKQVRRRGRVSLVLGTLVAAAILVGAASAAVWTDKADYAYGETVQIAGDGMTAGEGVSVDVSFPDGSLAQNHVVQADGSGNFSDPFDLVEGMPAGVYGVTATGQDSGNVFTTTFDPPPSNPTYGAAYDSTTPVDPASQQYSDKIAFKGTFTCQDAPSGACPTTDVTPTVTIQLKGTGIGDGATWTNVQVTTVAAFQFTTTSGGCSTACSEPWSIVWQVGRLADGTTSVPPGTYSYRANVTGLSGTIQVGGTGTGLTNAVTVTKENTTTTYNGDTTGGTSTPLSVSALVADQDGGTLLPSDGIFSPDDYLAGTAVVDFTLYSDNAMTTSVATDSPDTNILNTGATTGSPTVTLPATPGTYYMKTTYAGNTYYFGSYDGPDNIVVTSTEIQVCKAAPAIAADYLKQLSIKKKIKNSDNIVQLIADEMAKLTRAQFPTYTSASLPGTDPLLRPCPDQAAYKTSVENKTQYWINTLGR